jgi:hypothetical protein
VPDDLTNHLNLTRGARRIISSVHDDVLGLAGIQIYKDSLGVMANAMALRRDDLAFRLGVITADPLLSSDASTPLQDAIDAIDRDFETFWGKYEQSSWLQKLRERRELKLGLAYPKVVAIDALIKGGEGQHTEFKERFPDQARDLAKEFAAFGTSNPGVILLGVTDGGERIGLEDMGRMKDRDLLQTRIEGISSSGINPSLLVRIRFDGARNNTIAVIEVPKGPEPVYYTSQSVAYVRHGSLSRPASPQEINELHRRHFEVRANL